MKPYASDLSDAQWSILEPLIPAAKPAGRPRSVNMRQILNGIFSVLRSGGAWRLLPHDSPAWSTVYHYFRVFRNEGVWERIVKTLRECLRVQDGRQATPSAAILASQSVKTTERGGPLSPHGEGLGGEWLHRNRAPLDQRAHGLLGGSGEPSPSPTRYVGLPRRRASSSEAMVYLTMLRLMLDCPG
jgi:transposase